jgi:hypothetical protein
VDDSLLHSVMLINVLNKYNVFNFNLKVHVYVTYLNAGVCSMLISCCQPIGKLLCCISCKQTATSFVVARLKTRLQDLFFFRPAETPLLLNINLGFHYPREEHYSG